MDAHQGWDVSFLQRVLDALPDSAAILNDTGNIIQVNRAWVDFAVEGSLDDPGYFVGKNYLQVCDAAAGDERETALIVAQAIRSLIRKERSAFYIEYPCHSPTEQRWFMARMGRFEVETQLFVLVIHINITERVRAEQETLKTRIAIEATRQFSQFIRQTAHEFRTPLSLITTYLGLTRTQSDAQKRDQYLTKINEQTDYLTELTEQLNVLASLNSDGDPEPDWIDCNQIAESAHKTLRRKADAKHITLRLELQPDLPLVKGDDYKLLFAVCELVENALRYNQPSATVILRTSQRDCDVIIEVVDTGVGISPAHMEQIFEPYFKVDPSRTLNASGMGLGLTFVKRIVEMYRGHIEAESTVNEGSTFRIYLPVDDCPA